MLRSLYYWTLKLGNHRHAIWILAVVAFVESSFFPIPPDILLIPMVLAAPSKAWKIALTCTLASVLGGITGYGIGFLMFEEVGNPVLQIYGYHSKFTHFQATYNEWGAWAVFVAGVTPFPYKVVTILSGATALDPTVFVTASIMARGLRFFVVAALLKTFGPAIRGFIEVRLGLISILFCIVLIGGFLAFKFLF